MPALLPNPTVRLVICDGGDGIAERAAGRAEALGYRDVHILAGGIEGWKRAGYTLYAGVNVPSKTFGELIEHERHTPRVTAEAVENMRKAGENFVIVDGRPLTEYRRMNIPGGICCPNGELRAAHPRHRARSQDHDRRQLRGPHALHHRRPDADRFRRSKSGRCARERHAGVVPGGPAARAWRGPALPRAACGGQCCGPQDAGRQARRGPRRRVRCAGNGRRLARRRFAHDLPPRRAHARGVCSARRAGLRACARRPADPGDGPVGRRQGRAARADGRGGRAGAGRGGMAAPARTRGLCARGRDRRGFGAGLAAAADAFAKASDFEADGRP